jgi:hypothetical protein
MSWNGGTVTNDITISKSDANLFLNCTGHTNWQFESYTDGKLYISNANIANLLNLDTSGTLTLTGQLKLPSSLTQSAQIAFGNYNSTASPWMCFPAIAQTLYFRPNGSGIWEFYCDSGYTPLRMDTLGNLTAQGAMTSAGFNGLTISTVGGIWTNLSNNLSDGILINYNTGRTWGDILQIFNGGTTLLFHADASGNLSIAGRNQLTNALYPQTRQQLLDHLYKVGQAPEEYSAATIPQYISFGNAGDPSSFMFGMSLTDGGSEPVLYWNRAFAARKDIIAGGRLDTQEGVVSMLGGVGWGPNGYNSNPFIWLVGNQHGYPAKDTLEIRISTYSGGWVWSWGKLACGDITSAGSLYLTGNTNGYLWNNGGYIRQSGGNGFVADGTVTVGTYASGGAGSAVYFNANHQLCQGTSLREYKTNIETLDDASWIYSLRPVTFDWKDGKEAQAFGRQIGLIAEEVQAHAPLLTFNDDMTGQLRGVQYEKLAVPMLVELQKLRREVDELKTKLSAA